MAFDVYVCGRHTKRLAFCWLSHGNKWEFCRAFLESRLGKSSRTRLVGIFSAAETTHGKQDFFAATAATLTPLLHMYVAERWD